MLEEKIPDLNQLMALPKKKVLEYQKAVQQRNEELTALKAKGGEAWTPELQDELDELTVFLVDIEEAIEAKASKKNVYTPAPGTEKLVHIKLVKGRRFNPRNGVEESSPFIQMFTYGEWQLFRKSYVSLGYDVIEVLWDPYTK